MKKNPNNFESKKIIQLDRSRTQRSFDGKESLWDIEINRMWGLIEKHVESLERIPGEMPREQYPLLSIGIFGTPGSGKSSLLETFVHWINRKESRDVRQHHINIRSLPVIKPRFFEKSDHFLYTFLAVALNEDRKNREKEEKQYRDSSILSRLHQTFQEVSEYLQVIDDSGRPQEDDPLGVSLERLERHESGVKLTEKLGTFVTHLAETLAGKNPSLVLMPVDDADLSLETLTSTLDTCWRYLKHPRLVPIFTFTGRLAEELLRLHCESKLILKGRKDSPKELVEAATSLKMTENMALQYLGGLFPVRNRIRMGPAAARVLKANYRVSGAKYGSSETEEDRCGKPVINLLEKVSQLLFGYAESPLVSGVRAPLRMVTLRRQLQIVDAMQDAGIEELLDEYNTQSQNRKSWGQLFDLATWTLLNAHRDILKEIRMNLDDLYGWTPQGLQRVVLDSILSMDLITRRNLLKNWRYRSESRRSQMVSLLAVNVFRPRMKHEEKTGDDEDIISMLSENLQNWGDVNGDEYSFSISKGVIWFLKLCIGFYVPQILACHVFKEGDKPGKYTGMSNKNQEHSVDSDRVPGSLSSVGWDLMNGPIHAIREFIGSSDIFSTGMLMLIPDKFADAVKGDKKTNFYLHLWCFYGYEEKKPWAAVSLWRGLGLLGQLLNMEIVLGGITKEKRRKNIVTFIKNHYDAARVLGTSPKGEKSWEKLDNFPFSKWEWNFRYDEDKDEPEDEILNDFIGKIETWLDNIQKKGRWIYPMKSKGWETCFVSRLHGENLLNLLFQNLEYTYYKKPGVEKNEKEVVHQTEYKVVKEVVNKWCSVLTRYWNYQQCPEEAGRADEEARNVCWVGDLLMKCPIVRDFIGV